jgi:hypothetical protein
MAKGRLVQNALSVSALPSGFYTLRLSKVNAEPILLRFNKIN